MIMRIDFMACVISGTLAVASLAPASQLPPQSPQSPRPTSAERPPARGSEGMVTLEGCLIPAREIEGRAPKSPEAGVTDDYALTRAKVIKGSAPASLTGTYEVDDIEPGLLASYARQRVQIDGWFGELDRAANPAGRGGADADLVKIRGTAVRAIAKDCQN
jgi:hypothetical protein